MTSSGNHTSRAILICNSGGIPTSWNNPPSFDIHIVSGSINSVQISNGGKGFTNWILEPQFSAENIRKNRGLYYGDIFSSFVYFSGGGGSGAYGKLLTSITNLAYNSYDTCPFGGVNRFSSDSDINQANGSITGVLLIIVALAIHRHQMLLL